MRLAPVSSKWVKDDITTPQIACPSTFPFIDPNPPLNKL
jgi:hypothetical protein